MGNMGSGSRPYYRPRSPVALGRCSNDRAGTRPARLKSMRESPPRESLAFVACRDTLRGCIQLLQTIAITVDCSEAPPVLGSQTELVANTADVRIERARSDDGIGTPNAFADVSAREQTSDIAQEQDG